MQNARFGLTWLIAAVERHRHLVGGRTSFETSEPTPFPLGLGFSDDPKLAVGRFDRQFQMGLGGQDPKSLPPTSQVRAFGLMARFVCDNLAEPSIRFRIPEGVGVEAAAKGIACGLMQPGLFKTEASDDYYPGPDYGVLTSSVPVDSTFWPAVDRGLELGSLANLQRLLGGLPLNILNVETYSELVRTVCREDSPVQCTELSTKDLERMGLLQAVCRASGRAPAVQILRIDPPDGPTEEVDAIVGKGLVFDDGGAQLKLSPNMKGMHTDMMGSAAALATALYYDRHPDELERSLLCVLVLAENRLGPNGYMIEDILTAYNGNSVQVHNTDAEGRLVLADAVAYVCDTYAVRRLTTVATLTGHAVVVCGGNRSALMVRGNDSGLTASLVALADQAADPVQALTLEGGDKKALLSDTADLKNITGKPERGAQTGATFIQAFVPDRVKEVLHLDIASVCDTNGRAHLCAGLPSHAGVWSLIEWHRKR